MSWLVVMLRGDGLREQGGDGPCCGRGGGPMAVADKEVDIDGMSVIEVVWPSFGRLEGGVGFGGEVGGRDMARLDAGGGGWLDGYMFLGEVQGNVDGWYWI